MIVDLSQKAGLYICSAAPTTAVLRGDPLWLRSAALHFREVQSFCRNA